MTAKPKNNNRIYIITATVLVCILIFALLFLAGNGDYFRFSNSNSSDTEDFVRIIDVGQGDCTLIKSNGYCALIDTGPVENENDLISALTEAEVQKIDVLILSHLHNDHTGGIAKLFETYTVDNLILPELSTFSEGIYMAELAINEVTAAKGGVYNAAAGMNFELGDFELTVLASYKAMTDENDRSVVVMAKIEDKKFLFTGDMEKKSEQKLLEQNINIDCDVLKVAHHGSNTSSTKEFLAAASPSYCAISVGLDNQYGHPHKNILNSLKTINSEIFRTDQCGDITFRIKDKKIEVNTEIPK